MSRIKIIGAAVVVIIFGAFFLMKKNLDGKKKIEGSNFSGSAPSFRVNKPAKICNGPLPQEACPVFANLQHGMGVTTLDDILIVHVNGNAYLSETTRIFKTYDPTKVVPEKEPLFWKIMTLLFIFDSAQNLVTIKTPQKITLRFYLSASDEGAVPRANYYSRDLRNLIELRGMQDHDSMKKFLYSRSALPGKLDGKVTFYSYLNPLEKK